MSSINAAFDVRPAAVFFDALTAADKAASDANWNELLARTAPAPDTHMHCVCGAEYTSNDDAIVLDDEDIAAAADALAMRYGHRGEDSVVYAHQALVMIQAVNYRRAAAEHRAQCDWHADHEWCEADL